MSKYSPEYLKHIHRKPITLDEVKKAIQNEKILEARVIKCCDDSTLILELGDNIVAEIKLEDLEYHWDNTETKRAAATSKINKNLKFRPLEVIEKDGTYVVKSSRKEVQKECFEKFIKKLKAGDIIDAHVTKVYNYGIFCDIGCGIIALLPTNNISVTHIVDPVKSLKNIGELKVIVKSIDENYKIELSHRELLGTWEQEVSKFEIGDIVCGTVLSVEDYGVFVRLSQNLSGLADKTNMSLKTGDTVAVKIVSIKDENMKVKLFINEKLREDSVEDIKFNYVIDDKHIDHWVYSTSNAKRTIESYF